MIEIRQYTTAAGKNPFELWLESLADARAQAIVAARLDRLVSGSFGDTKHVGGGVSELRIDHGPGYRIYYARIGLMVVLLLCGGNKRRQSADISKAVTYLKDYRRRSAQS